MRVTVDVFSGRPNPSFDLDPDEADGIRQAIGSLPASTAGRPEPPDLGYRGWTIEDERLGRVHVYGENVGDRADASRSLERLLLASARRHLGPGAVPEEWIRT